MTSATTSTTTTRDRIEKKVFLRAKPSRVWRAISDVGEFGAWFGVEFDGPFVAGTKLVGRVVPTKADPEIAKTQEPYAGMKFELEVDRVEPEHHFSFRWHPFAIDPKVDYSKEAMTLVVFELAADGAGTRLTITESGFDKIPLERRARAFAANDGGWQEQARLIEKYLAREAQAG
jgi:uncharacterized protein YndB with AHSA1/START domain